MTSVSLVIPTRDRASFLARTLASFTRQTTTGFEVVVVDDGGEDSTRDVARAYATELDLRYVRRAHRGTAAARNAAVRAARGDLLVFVDDDRVADRGFVADHLAAHDGSPRLVCGRQRGLFAEWSRDAAYTPADVATLLGRRPDLAARLGTERAELVAPAMIADDLPAVVASFGLDEPWWQAWVVPAVAAHGPALDGFAFPWTVAVTGNLSVPRAAAERVGLFDESFVGWGLEDTDFAFRLHLTGAPVHVLDGGVNYHQVHHRGHGRKLEWASNAVRLIEKHASLEICLYLAMARGRITVEEAGALVREHAALGGRARALTAELIRVHREHFRSLAPLTV